MTRDQLLGVRGSTPDDAQPSANRPARNNSPTWDDDRDWKEVQEIAKTVTSNWDLIKDFELPNATEALKRYEKGGQPYSVSDVFAMTEEQETEVLTKWAEIQQNKDMFNLYGRIEGALMRKRNMRKEHTAAAFLNAHLKIGVAKYSVDYGKDSVFFKMYTGTGNSWSY